MAPLLLLGLALLPGAAVRADSEAPAQPRPERVDAEAGACTFGTRGTGPDPRVWFADGSEVRCHGCNTCTCEHGAWTFLGLPCPPGPIIQRCSASDASSSDVRSELVYLDRSALVFNLETNVCPEEDYAPVKVCWDGAVADTVPPTVNLRVVRTAPPRCASMRKSQKIYQLGPVSNDFPSPALISLDGRDGTLYQR